MNINESNFIHQIINKNPKALEFTVDNYSNLVFKVVRSILNTGLYAQHTEECVNDVFWTVWQNIESFDLKLGNFKCWIAAIAKYKAIDYKRKLYKRSTEECINEYSMQDDMNMEEALILKENKAELLEAINCMKAEDKEIFIRRYFLDQEIENIAKTFGVERNIVDKRLSRGRKFLREQLTLLKGEI